MKMHACENNMSFQSSCLSQVPMGACLQTVEIRFPAEFRWDAETTLPSYPRCSKPGVQIQAMAVKLRHCCTGVNRDAAVA